MANIGKISPIKKEYSSTGMDTMQGQLSRHGMTRLPGTGVLKYPYKELDGKYRTGLDENAAYIQRIVDKTERELEIDRVVTLRKKLESDLGGIDLSARSPFWNYALSKSTSDVLHVQPYKLIDGDNIFDFSVPFQELTFSWLRVHPTIASSRLAYERGEYPADTQFYVVDDNVESKVLFKKKQLINKAIVKFESMSIEKKRKVARQLGLPVTEDTQEEQVYNLVDNILKQTEFKSGKHAGLDPVKVFLTYADMDNALLHIKDLVKQAIAHSIYRVKDRGKVYEGDVELAIDEDTLVKYYMDETNQKDLLMLENKLRSKKLAAV